MQKSKTFSYSYRYYVIKSTIIWKTILITSITSITYKLAVRARVSLEFEVAVIHSLQN